MLAQTGLASENFPEDSLQRPVPDQTAPEVGKQLIIMEPERAQWCLCQSGPE